METENRKHIAQPEPKPVLADGFGDDDYLEGVFLIEAKTFNTFFNRKMKLQEVTGFSDGCFDSYEEDEDGGCWKIITTAWFKNIDELKKVIKSMERYNWFYINDSCIMLDGEYLFCDGRWIV